MYDDEFDLLCDVIRHMPAFVETRTLNEQPQWFIWNETTTGENFAEKWNQDAQRARAFFSWQARALADIEKLSAMDGLDSLTRSLSDTFGPGPANHALARLTEGHLVDAGPRPSLCCSRRWPYASPASPRHERAS